MFMVKKVYFAVVRINLLTFLTYFLIIYFVFYIFIYFKTNRIDGKNIVTITTLYRNKIQIVSKKRWKVKNHYYLSYIEKYSL